MILLAVFLPGSVSQPRSRANLSTGEADELALAEVHLLKLVVVQPQADIAELALVGRNLLVDLSCRCHEGNVVGVPDASKSPVETVEVEVCEDGTEADAVGQPALVRQPRLNEGTDAVAVSDVLTYQPEHSSLIDVVKEADDVHSGADATHRRDTAYGSIDTPTSTPAVNRIAQQRVDAAVQLMLYPPEVRSVPPRRCVADEPSLDDV